MLQLKIILRLKIINFLTVLIKVDKHISDLLYAHDCVIVPNLGGFVANYAPAKIHLAQHTFTPPSKNIIFNKHLKNNDGLLANHIVTAENTSYPEALKYLHHFTSTTNVQLKNGAKVTIEDVGTLFLDAERNIQFEQGTINYLQDAFGLSRFQSPPIKRDTIGKRIEKEFIDRGPIPAEKKKVNIKRLVALAIATPLVFAMIWIPLKTDLLKNSSYSALNPFAVSGIPKNVVLENTKPDFSKNEVSEPALLPNDTIKFSGINSSAKNSQPVTTSIADSPIVEAVKADSTHVAAKDPNLDLDLKFHLITGCFQIEDNANRFLTDLQSQNITASIIGKRNGLYVVSSGDYATRKEAFMELKELKKSQPDAWLLIK